MDVRHEVMTSNANEGVFLPYESGKSFSRADNLQFRAVIAQLNPVLNMPTSKVESVIATLEPYVQALSDIGGNEEFIRWIEHTVYTSALKQFKKHNLFRWFVLFSGSTNHLRSSHLSNVSSLRLSR